MTVVLTASTGGHLSQLYALKRVLVPGGTPVHWITFDTAQSRSMLARESVSYVAFTAPRDFHRVLQNATGARRLLKSVGASSVISTGSAIALSYLPVAAAMGLDVQYVESAARSDGPSLTGRILARIPRIAMYTQYPAWASRRWRFRNSIFDAYLVAPPENTNVALRKIVVSLGTLDYPFDRLVDRLVEILPPDVEVLWQTGGTDVSRWGLEGRAMLPERELRAAVNGADVLVAHAGCGAALLALDAGKTPVLVPRRPRHGEHVDDHQQQIALELARRGLALHREADALTMDDLKLAARGRVSVDWPAPEGV